VNPPADLECSDVPAGLDTECDRFELDLDAFDRLRLPGARHQRRPRIRRPPTTSFGVSAQKDRSGASMTGNPQSRTTVHIGGSERVSSTRCVPLAAGRPVTLRDRPRMAWVRGRDPSVIAEESFVSRGSGSALPVPWANRHNGGPRSQWGARWRCWLAGWRW
jgi:hypothetical protein